MTSRSGERRGVHAHRSQASAARRCVTGDLSTEVFGVKWETPLFICPVGGQRAFYTDGELATARAAKAKRHTMILPNVSSYEVEEMEKTLGTPPWQQLYMPLDGTRPRRW